MKMSATTSRAIWTGLTLMTLGSGCTHNYYYGGVPGCPPYGQTVTTQVGQVCEAPVGTIVSSNGGTITTQDGVAGATSTQNTPQRVVISQPAYNPSLGSRLGWRKANESLATTRVDGALTDSTTTTR